MDVSDIDRKFAQRHEIPLSYAFHYRMGREHYKAGEPYSYPTAPTPEDAWFFAGYADAGIRWRTKK